MSKRQRVLVAMSGGVDSSTAAAILREEGYDVIGVMMQLHREGEGRCCTLDDTIDARRVADKLGIPFYVVNFMEPFRKYVMDDFVQNYLSGRTPNPCVLCNRTIKFNLLLKKAISLGASFIATGHYARVGMDKRTGRFSLFKGVDEDKDQSYFLFTLTQGELPYIIFPLGSMSKEEVRERAEGFGLRVAKKDESQGLCFIPGGEDYRWFLRKFANINVGSGEIADTQGNVLGNHKGVFSFTVGQRRGLGVAVGKPLYVLKIDPASNRVVVGEEEGLYRKNFVVNKVNWIEEAPTEPMEVEVRIRYRHPGKKALLYPKSSGEAAVEFVTPQRAITPGQAAVFYSGTRVLGGGWIREVL